MKIRNLLVMAITIALGAISAAAQEPDGSKTFTDQSKQSITISRFGTVLSFTNSNGKKIVPKNAYRVCLCGEKNPCIDSATAPSDEIRSALIVVSQTLGTALKNKDTLVVSAKFHKDDLTMERRLTWVAGSSLVRIDETVSAPKALCFSTFAAQGQIVASKMCPSPPQYYLPN
ncbi:MAG: hypothetical protein ACREA9_09445, partial [Pyrinomonadaceae bacterium]